MLLDKFTRMPPAGAADARFTVPVAFVCPPTTVEGAIPSEEIVPDPAEAAVTVSPAEALFADVAVMVAFVALPTAADTIVKLAEVCPCGITRLAGTPAAALLLDRFT